MKSIAVAAIMKHGPCHQEDEVHGYPESRVRELIGTGKTPLECCDLDIPPEDIIWLFTRPGILPRRVVKDIRRLFQGLNNVKREVEKIQQKLLAPDWREVVE